MTKAILFISGLLLTQGLFSQIKVVDLYHNFDSCFQTYLTQLNKNKKDSLIIVYERNSVILHKSYNQDDENYSIVKDKFDTARKAPLTKGNVTVMYDYSFDFFMNYILNKHSLDSVSIDKFESGDLAFVSVPGDSWTKFYFDLVLGYDTLTLSPWVEYFNFEKDFVLHTRYQVQCFYTKKKGFNIVRMDKIRSRRLSY